MITWDYAKTLLGKVVTITDSQTEESYTGKAKELHLSDSGLELIMIEIRDSIQGRALPYRYGVPLPRVVVNYVEEVKL